MAQFAPFQESFSLEDQLSILGEDELLDFWEESQMLNKYLDSEHETAPSARYETAILNELRLRSMGR